MTGSRSVAHDPDRTVYEHRYGLLTGRRTAAASALFRETRDFLRTHKVVASRNRYRLGCHCAARDLLSTAHASGGGPR